MKRKTLLLTLALLPIGLPFAKITDSKQEGWFWYKYEKPEEKEKKKKEDKKKEQTQEVKEPPKVSVFLTDDELKKLDVDTFQKHHEWALKNAMSNPTKENILYYLKVKEIMETRSAEFANLVNFYEMQALQKERSQQELALYREAQSEERRRFINKIIEENREDFAILFFKRDDCQYCQAQKQILDSFMATYNFNVVPVDIVLNPQVAKKFNVTAVPTLVLIYRKSKEPFYVALGVISLSDLTNRVIFGIRYLKGEVKPQDWGRF